MPENKLPTLPDSEMERINGKLRRKSPVQVPLERRAPSPDDQGPVIIDINPQTPADSDDSNTWKF